MPPPRMTTKWFEVHEELVAFAEALDNAGVFDARSDLFYMLRKPWKWDDEYAKWIDAGRPNEFEVVS
jgi:hypothetical protein